MKNDVYYLLDILRERLDYPSLTMRVIDHAHRLLAHNVLIEDKGSGTELIQDLRFGKTGIKPIDITPDVDKVTRMSNQSAQIEAGRVIRPETASWVEDFKAELLTFPNGRFDDQVDSLSQFLSRAEYRRTFKFGTGRAIGWC